MIENTSKRNPLLNLIGLTNGLRPDTDDSEAYITGMEAAGQAQLVSGAELPASGPWGELEALGFVRGEPIPGDDLFVQATLPKGWSKKATDHSMHSKVVDERGIERVSVFYKAAYYDRRADMHLVDPGRSLAGKAIWDDGAPALPDCWSLLIDDEKRDFAESLKRSLATNLEEQEYYGSGPSRTRREAQADRIRALLLLVPGGDA